MSTPATPGVPFGLRGITIENFRGISSLELSFLDAFQQASDVVVLGGPNGSGKTAVLEACLLALGHNELLQGASGRDAVRAGARDYRIAARLQAPDAEYLAECRASGDPTWRNGTSPHGSHAVEVPCLYFSSWRGPRLVGAIPIAAGERGKRPPDNEVNRLLLVKQYLVNAKAHAFMREKARPPEACSPYEMGIQQLNEMWGAFHPGSGQQFAVEPVSEEPEAGFDVFLIEASQQRIPLDALSSGQLELFLLFGSLLRLKSQEGLVVIDEPELHLDAQWHALLLRTVRRFLPKAQLIVATHSPKVYDSVFSFQHHFLVPEDDPRAKSWKAQAEAGAGT